MSNELRFDNPITEVIKSRVSVRGYKKQEISEDIINKINNYISEAAGPFNAKVRLKLINSMEISKDSDVKLGTYGVIRGTSTFIIAATQKGEMCLEQLGYILESVILYVTSLGLGTCWLGGTFKRGEFAKAIGLKKIEILPVVTPVGYPKQGTDVINSLFRKVAGSNKRKEWNELFFSGSFSSPIKNEEAGNFIEVLEMVRRAPSASNKQPWRIVKEGDNYHFYMWRTKGYGEGIGFDVQKIDMGIAMCHFEFTARDLGIKGEWVIKEPSIGSVPENTEYIVSWITK